VLTKGPTVSRMRHYTTLWDINVRKWPRQSQTNPVINDNFQGKVRWTEYSSSQEASPLRELTCHMGSHSITYHPAEVTFPPLPGTVVWYLRCGNIVNNRIKTGLLLSLLVKKNKIGKYLSWYRAKDGSRRAVNCMMDRRTKCTRQPSSCCNFAKCIPILDFFFTGWLSN